jgi:hypothetical protein
VNRDGPLGPRLQSDARHEHIGIKRGSRRSGLDADSPQAPRGLHGRPGRPDRGRALSR